MLQIPNALIKSPSKSSLHRSGKAFLRSLAAALNLKVGEFDLRSNQGGDAVMGEVTLHADFIYVQIGSAGLSAGGVPRILYRTCNGRRDYCGDQNRYVNLDTLVGQGGQAAFLKTLDRLVSEKRRDAIVNGAAKTAISQPLALAI
ncbi:hypothetical protein LA345_39885 (plasmid) [Burkholderia vietnamiensis]|uniref:Uncharacterized protein n=1 Tax=Burkholderia vietnamiensis (strain G4 / LMG 22486) TaxID=269482 RepID=A4JUD2_BURVG|nr:hypothetical protein Bcep1808_6999 [Burkholderia vietnamiensis G4]MCB4349953.1 hypothetical protein [Burkholderia vietnamiensis]